MRSCSRFWRSQMFTLTLTLLTLVVVPFLINIPDCVYWLSILFNNISICCPAMLQCILFICLNISITSKPQKYCRLKYLPWKYSWWISLPCLEEPLCTRKNNRNFLKGLQFYYINLCYSYFQDHLRVTYK